MGERKRSGRGGGAPKWPGLLRPTQKAYFRDLVDYDYLGQLSDDEQQWLENFTNAWYGGDFSWDDDQQWSPEERRLAYGRNNAARRDLLALGLNLGRSDEAGEKSLMGTTSDDTADWSHTPDYLDTPEYKKALAAFRRVVADGHGVDSLAYRSAHHGLARTLKSQNQRGTPVYATPWPESKQLEFSFVEIKQAQQPRKRGPKKSK